ncbi:hypothetical protein C0J52_19286 [Blattella germanica]|nr:hypothetical protein C0J52_19286 [Blattella germanica]
MKPSSCTSSKTLYGHHCIMTCPLGYRVLGPAVLVCLHNQQWSRPDVPHSSEVPQPFIQCPRDVKVDLPPHQKTAHVRIPQPKSNMDWWRGKPNTESPRVDDCPESFEIQLLPGETSRTVSWVEPIFTDNIGVDRIYKSKEPGQLMSPGLHHVNYLAHDTAGNRAKCHFSIHVKDSDYRQDAPRLALNGRKTVICPKRVPSINSATPNYPWQLPAGCYFRRTRTQVIAGSFTVHQGSIPAYDVTSTNTEVNTQRGIFCSIFKSLFFLIIININIKFLFAYSLMHL